VIEEEAQDYVLGLGEGENDDTIFRLAFKGHLPLKCIE